MTFSASVWISVSAVLLVTQPAPPAPAPTMQPAPRDPALDAAIDAALGVPPRGAPVDPTTRADPGFVGHEATRPADQSYGSTATALDAQGNLVGGLTIVDTQGLSPGEGGYLDETPDFHVVQDGDTLWAISQDHLADPYLWPKLWSWNEHVTNPHWIFPGDRIRLFDPNDPRAQPGLTRGPALSFERTLPPKAKQESYLLSQIAFVTAAEFDTSMKVKGGADANVMMSTLDTVYMSYDRGNPPIPGERLIVYAPTEAVRNIKNREIIGYVVQVMGEVEIETIAREAAEGTIVGALNPIERGYRVGPLRRVWSRVPRVPAEQSASGRVVATLTSTGPIPIRTRRSALRRQDHYVLAGDEQFVVTDLGQDDGVLRGNVLEVVRKGDGYTKKRVFTLPYEEGWPRHVIGAILVVDVDERTSLGVTIYAAQEFERGDHVELRGPGLADDDTPADPAVEGRGTADADGRVRIGR